MTKNLKSTKCNSFSFLPVLPPGHQGDPPVALLLHQVGGDAGADARAGAGDEDDAVRVSHIFSPKKFRKVLNNKSEAGVGTALLHYTACEAISL